MLRKLIVLLCLASACALLYLAARRTPVVHSQTKGGMSAAVASVRLQFGLKDREAQAWEGTVSATAGDVADVRHWRPRPGDKIEGNRFALATRTGVNFAKRAWEPPAMEPPRAYLLEPGLIVDARGTGATRLRIETSRGAFDVAPFNLRVGQTQTFLDGAVIAERVATAQPLSNAGADSDFATLVAHGNQAWAAWVAFREGKNEVQMRHFNGVEWGPVETVSAGHTDIFLVKAARDKNGEIWLVWSAQEGSNWDLYARRRSGRGFGAVERLTDDPQPDIYHAMTADSSGNVWVTWQGFRNGKSDVFARRFDGRQWSAAERVSSSSANDWLPAIAADRAGRVYIAWDTYDRGNYDVVLRKFENGMWSEALTVANTGKFEAYVSLACDKQNRLWVAWNEAGFEWGKDYGFLLKIEGAPLYRSRSMRVGVWDNGEWKEPAADVNTSLPAHLHGYNDLPVLQSDSAGRMWLFFRHRLLRIRDVPPDTPAHRAAWEIYGVSYDGGQWSAPVTLPFSAGRQDMRAGFAAGTDGVVFAAYPTDHRDFEDFLYQRSAVVAARVPVPSTASAQPFELQPREYGPLKSFPIHPNEPEDLARIRNEAWALNGKTYKIYRGDIHRHTEFSMDGNNDGSLLDAYRYAIDAASLDYLMVSEHNGAGGPDNNYPNWLLQQMADLFYLPGTFVPLYGYERSVAYPNGHRNVVFAKRGTPTLPIPPEESKGQRGAQALYAYLKKFGGIAVSHTSATNMGTDWRDNDPEVEPLVEIYQGDRVSAEYEGAPKAAFAANPSSAPGGFRPAGYVWNAWAKGYKLGVQVSSDHLSTHISYACTIATDFTRQGLIDAMKLRHSYGATDNIILDYRVEIGGKQYLQGEQVKTGGSPYQLVVDVKGTKPIRQIDIIRDNRFIHTRHPLSQETQFRFGDTEPLSKESYYYVRVIQVDDQIAWSSPVWLSR